MNRIPSARVIAAGRGSRAGFLPVFLGLASACLSGMRAEASEVPASAAKAIAPDGHVFTLELALTPQQQALGYMYRNKVPSNQGMLFVFPDSDFHSFWMKNCRVALDILWLSDDLTIVHLEAQVPPCLKDPCPGYAPMSKARYVLEIASGQAKKHHLRVGQRIEVSGIDFAAQSSAR